MTLVDERWEGPPLLISLWAGDTNPRDEKDGSLRISKLHTHTGQSILVPSMAINKIVWVDCHLEHKPIGSQSNQNCRVGKKVNNAMWHVDGW